MDQIIKINQPPAPHDLMERMTADRSRTVEISRRRAWIKETKERGTSSILCWTVEQENRESLGKGYRLLPDGLEWIFDVKFPAT